MKMILVAVVMGAAVVGCTPSQRADSRDAGNATVPGDPDARKFTGTIFRLNPFTSTMKITKEEKIGKDAFPNQIVVKYDEKTKFLMDGQPTTIEQIQQYMTVRVEGRMRDGQMFAEVADFSSVLPEKVKKAPAKAE